MTYSLRFMIRGATTTRLSGTDLLPALKGEAFRRKGGNAWVSVTIRESVLGESF